MSQTSHRIAAAALALALAASAAAQSLSGIVTDAEGTPIPGARVHGILNGATFVMPHPEPAPLATTATDGTFAIDETAAAAWPGLLVSATDRAHVTISTDRAASRPIVLPIGRILAGTVRDPEGKPLASVRVEARDWLGVSPLFAEQVIEGLSDVEPRTAVLTDARGQFVLRGICEHGLALIVGGNGFERRSYGPLSAGDPFDTRVRAVPVVNVVVTDDQGTPLDGLAVQVWRTGTTDLNAKERGVTDASGSYAFEWFDGVTTLGVLADDGRWLASTELDEHQKTVELTVPYDALHPQPAADLIGRGRIRGRVVDPDTGRGVVGATVGVVPGGVGAGGVRFVHGDAATRETLTPRTQTDADGKFELSALPGPYALAVAWTGFGQPGWRRNPTPVTVQVDADRPVEGTSLALQPLIDVRGTVRADRPLVDGIWVEIIPGPGPRTWRRRFSRIDDAGAFAFEGIAPGRYALFVRAAPGARHRVPTSLATTSFEWPGPATVDLREDVPTVLRGRVTSNVPTQRLAVVSVPPYDLELGSGLRWRGSVGLVGRDGSYRCAEEPGPRVVAVVDLATGVPLWAGEPTELEAGDRTLDIAFEAHRLDVAIADEHRRENAWLSIVADADSAGPFAILPEGPPPGFGLALHRDRQPPSLWLAAGDYEVAVESTRGGEVACGPVGATIGAEGDRAIGLHGTR